MRLREHLVIVLPGIGGSVLAPPGSPDAPVWDAGYGDVGNILLRPERLSLGEHERLEPVGLIRTRKAFGIWTVVPGYDGLLARLGNLPDAVVDDGTPAGHNLHANVVAVPYDFRRSIVEAAQRLDDQVQARLAALWPGEAGRPRVVIVAHSMGGLVARYWLSHLDTWPLCRSLITLGTPHRGAPKALDALANGINAKVGRIRRPVPVLREWPGVAELLPRYPAIRDASPDGAGQLLRPYELPLPWLQGPAAAAWKVHQHIEAAWSQMPRTGPEVIPRIGYGHTTLRRCTFDGIHLRVTDAAPDLAEGGALGDWVGDLGDGTVPADSGLPLEMDRHTPFGVRAALRHGPIADLKQIPDLLESYEGRPPALPTRGEERPVVLGVGIDEVTVAGAAIEVTARVIGTEYDVAAAPVWATLTAAEERCDVQLRWDSAADCFRGDLSATTTPGLARVTVTAEAVPGGGDLTTEQTVEVIDGADLD